MSTRLYVDPDRLRAGTVTITGDDYRYLFRVRRLAVGSEVVLFDGEGRCARARVAAVTGEAADLEAGAPEQAPAPDRPRLVALVALIKGDRMDWCVQKLVEVGADDIVPLVTGRAVVRLHGARAARRRERWSTIARQAARQCRRTTVPTVAGPCPLTDALERVRAVPLKLLLWEGAGDGLREQLPARPPSAVALLTGPEGGLTPEEVDLCRAAGFAAARLGPRTLRAETAPLVAASVIQFTLGDLG